MTAEKQRENVRVAAAELAPLAGDCELVVCHGNGPQVGLLALQAAAGIAQIPRAAGTTTQTPPARSPRARAGRTTTTPQTAGWSLPLAATAPEAP